MSCRVCLHASNADTLDSLMFLILLAHEHFRILNQLGAIVTRYAVGLEMAIDKGVILPIYQLFIVESCRLRSKLSLIGLLLTSKEEKCPSYKNRHKRSIHAISVG